MGSHSRRKGAVGEREVVALAIEHGFPKACRAAPMQCGHGDDFPDVAGVGRLRIEVKRRGKGSMYALAVDACQERAGEIPVLAYREDRGPWLAVLPLPELLKLERDALGRSGGGVDAAMEEHLDPPCDSAGKDLSAGPA